MSTPDEAFFAEILAHGRKQLEKGWSPGSTAGNLSARFGLTEDCGKRVVGAMMATRVGPTLEQLAGEMATSLELSMEEATARVVEVRTGRVDPDDWSTFVLEFAPGRAPSYAPTPADAEPNPPSTRSAAADDKKRSRGPMRIEINLLPDADRKERKGGGLFGSRH